MIPPDRRRHPRWTQAARWLPPIKLSLRLPLLVGCLAVAVNVYVAAQARMAGADNYSVAVSAPASATPATVWGVDGRGVAYTLETNPRWPMIWFRMELKERR